LAASADAFMAAFTEREEEQKRAQARRRQEPDEDGFVMVTRRGGSGRNRPADPEELKAQLAERGGKGKLKGFYGWQIREERKERQKELVKKFEEDRKRVAEKKKGRRFRPG
jgi:ribosomal RNA-processing protein 7